MVETLEPVEVTLGDVGRLGTVTLRPWRAGDLDAVLEAFEDPDIVRWTTQVAAPDRTLVRDWLTDRAAHWADGTMATWAATGGDAVLGSVGLKRLDLARLEPPRVHTEVMYWLTPAARGHGLATALARFATRWAHDTLGLHRVELRHELDNAGSCGVAGRAGYALEGTLRRSFPTPRGWVDEHLHAWVAADGVGIPSGA